MHADTPLSEPVGEANVSSHGKQEGNEQSTVVTDVASRPRKLTTSITIANPAAAGVADAKRRPMQEERSL
jgi:hypothetical protein